MVKMLMYYVKKCFRTSKVFFPGLNDTKFLLQRTIRKLTRTPHEPDFKILQWIPAAQEANYVFVDIGANRGQTIESVRLYSKCKIVSFEPNVKLFKRLASVCQEDSNVKVYNLALCNENSTLYLFIPWYRGFCFDGIASTIESEATNWLNSEKMYFFREKYIRIEQISVPTQRLDDLHIVPDFLKIDVQGAELQVLQGAMETIQQASPIIMLERPKEREEVAFLDRLGYSPYYLKNNFFLPGVGAHNTFFFKTEHQKIFTAKFGGRRQ